MKATKIMVATIAIFLTTWMVVSFIGWCLSDNSTFKQIVTHEGCIMFMLVIGWVPSVIVAGDLTEQF